MQKVHKLKIWSKHFVSILLKQKTFEVRKDDRDFCVGDELILQEFNPVKKIFSRREVTCIITYKLDGGQFGIKKGYCVLGINIW